MNEQDKTKRNPSKLTDEERAEALAWAQAHGMLKLTGSRRVPSPEHFFCACGHNEDQHWHNGYYDPKDVEQSDLTADERAHWLLSCKVCECACFELPGAEEGLTP